MPGTGKTSIGKRLASKLGLPFIDLDAYIEEKTKLFIDQIIEQYGENTFRAIESECLAEINIDDAVISTGGGIVTVKSNKTLMNGLKVYLDTSLDTIKKRLAGSYARPLLKKVSLDTLYDQRFLKYQDFADVIIANNDAMTQAVFDIIKAVEEWKKK